MQVKAILDQQNGVLISVPPGTSVPGAAELLFKQEISAAVVAGPDGKILGILSERDITRAVAEHCTEIAEMPVEDLMVRDVLTCNVTCDIVEAMEIMRVNRVRHLPVVDAADCAIGMISMRDMMEVCVGDMMSMGMAV